MKRFTAVVLTSAVLVSSPIYAESSDVRVAPRGDISASVARTRFDRERSLATSTGSAVATATRAAKKTAAIKLGVLGALLGGWIGQKLDSDCHCDDPGLRGGLIGVQVGGALGAVVGWQLVR